VNASWVAHPRINRIPIRASHSKIANVSGDCALASRAAHERECARRVPKQSDGDDTMKKLLLATVASFALSLPAMAQSHMHQSQQPGSQNQVDQQQLQDQPQSQGQNGSNNQQQAQNTISPSQLDKQQIRQIQQTLNKQGFDAGHVDGRWGADTAEALKDYQQRNQMQANGKLDQQTLQALGVNMTAQQNGQQNGVAPQQPSSTTTGAGSSEDEPMQRQNPSASPSDQSGSQMQNPSGDQNQK
jgi:opacity protein-like surface antigen